MDSETPLVPQRIDSREHPRLIASSQATQETNFFRSCHLCANGAVALTTTEDRVIEVYSLPVSLDDTESTQFTPTRRFAQPGSILGALWFPTAVPEDPSAFCFLASVRECPIKLLDASDGRVNTQHPAAIRIVDHRERQIAPHSMAFNSMVSKLYCGFQDAIEVFDINYPGEGERLFTTPSKKSRSGLKGIISALDFCPDYSGIYAAGTFSSSLVLYDESTQAEILQSLGGVAGPVTQVKFNAMRPHMVYAASRLSNTIQSWDIRGDTSMPLQEFPRNGLTNQRLNFALDAYGSTLVTGDKDGYISCFDLTGESQEKPTLKYKAHDDAIAATALHPIEPTLISVSGSRHFDDSDDSERDDAIRARPPVSRDTSIKMWRFPATDYPQWESHYPTTEMEQG